MSFPLLFDTRCHRCVVGEQSDSFARKSSEESLYRAHKIPEEQETYLRTGRKMALRKKEVRGAPLGGVIDVESPIARFFSFLASEHRVR